MRSIKEKIRSNIHLFGARDYRCTLARNGIRDDQNRCRRIGRKSRLEWIARPRGRPNVAHAVRGAGAAFEAHAYPGSGHLLADPDLPEHDLASSEAMWERVLAFLDRIDA